MIDIVKYVAFGICCFFSNKSYLYLGFYLVHTVVVTDRILVEKSIV